MMDPLAVRARIRPKLADGRLPRDAHVAPYDGGRRPERCDACDEPISKVEAVIECASANRRAQYFHTECMYIWYLERSAITDGETGSPRGQSVPARGGALPAARYDADPSDY